VPGLIIFWNIARTQGAGVIAEDLQDDLSALQGACNPDVIVLCEAQKLTRRNLIAGNDLRLIGTYVAPAFAKAASVNHPPAPGLLAGGRVAANLGSYGMPTTLRYILIHRQGLNCNPCLLDIQRNRPALAFQLESRPSSIQRSIRKFSVSRTG
jgi:hypothetical protein